VAGDDFGRVHQSSEKDGAAVALAGDLHGVFEL
jgi:hypothetical protein